MLRRRDLNEPDQRAGAFDIVHVEHNENFIEPETSQIQQIEQIPQNTMDQGILKTLHRQIVNVMYKFRLTFIPIISEQGINALRNWDMWGPFIMCLLFIFVINGGDNFMLLLRSVFIGATVTGFNVRVLGGQISYLQSVSILGYCLVPLVLAVIILEFLKLGRIKSMAARTIAISIGALWSMLCIFDHYAAARAFITVNIKPDRRFVAIYPICLFYLYEASHLIFMR